MGNFRRSRWAVPVMPAATGGGSRTSVDQYGATLAQWFGVADSDLPSIFPNIANFATPTVSFLG